MRATTLVVSAILLWGSASQLGGAASGDAAAPTLLGWDDLPEGKVVAMGERVRDACTFSPIAVSTEVLPGQERRLTLRASPDCRLVVTARSVTGAAHLAVGAGKAGVQHRIWSYGFGAFFLPHSDRLSEVAGRVDFAYTGASATIEAVQKSCAASEVTGWVIDECENVDTVSSGAIVWNRIRGGFHWNVAGNYEHYLFSQGNGKPGGVVTCTQWFQGQIVWGVDMSCRAVPCASEAAGVTLDNCGPSLCDAEPVHTYGGGGSVGARSQTASAGRGVGLVTVTDTNSDDCDGDGVPGDWDGDLDAGIGGGAFGYGTWAGDPDCNYGLNAHGPNVAVNDLVYSNQIGFVVGEDDQSGPVKTQDPATGEWRCTTDGSITPCGSTGCGPTDDPDDCLSPRYVGVGTTCGTGGGDGLYWVFLDGLLVAEDGGVTITNAPTSGTITAF